MFDREALLRSKWFRTFRRLWITGRIAVQVLLALLITTPRK
jgi:hypothetical protein